MPGHAVHGRFPKDHSGPFHDQHVRHFEQAFEDALENWDQGDVNDARVTFTVDVSGNPGGVKEYKVTIGG